MRPTLRTVSRLLVIATLAAASAGCSLGRDDDDDPPNGDAFGDGGSLGSIDRLPGGTPVATNVRTLLGVSCTGETLQIRTNLEAITATMECDRMFPAAVIDNFVSKPVAITYNDERLIVESADEGTLEFPAKDPTVAETNATP